MKTSIFGGALAGLATCAIAGWCAKMERKPFLSPVNATSHIVWGDKAAAQDDLSWRFTGTGVLLNELALIFWAGLYEAWRRRNPSAPPLARGVGVSAFAYVVDYLVIPERFTPGFEKRLSGRSLFMIYGGIAASLAFTNDAAGRVIVRRSAARPDR